MRVFGSLNNRLMENSAPVTPEVGMGATELCYSDRNAYTVIEVRSPRRIVVQRDTATRADNWGMSDCQNYTYAPNPKGATRTLSLRKDGRWRAVGDSGTVYALGYRDEHYDYSF